MRTIKIKEGDFELKDKVKIVLEKIVTKFGNSAKADVPKRYIGKRAYIIILED
jgi:putative transposon-encoded protein